MKSPYPVIHTPFFISDMIILIWECGVPLRRPVLLPSYSLEIAIYFLQTNQLISLDSGSSVFFSELVLSNENKLPTILSKTGKN